LLVLVPLSLAVHAQGDRPPFQTTKVEGTDNVYVFRYGNHQAMFVVTKDGVIATDPIAYGRPQAALTYIEEIKKVSDKPIKYLIYSHHHFDHIAGGKAFKDAGHGDRAHAGERAPDAAQGPHTVMPDETVDKTRNIRPSRIMIMIISRTRSTRRPRMTSPSDTSTEKARR
jgi:glyoxylase-like metal-dependent hydrolase (beta-lactamase superfamily II)